MRPRYWWHLLALVAALVEVEQAAHKWPLTPRRRL